MNLHSIKPRKTVPKSVRSRTSLIPLALFVALSVSSYSSPAHAQAGGWIRFVGRCASNVVEKLVLPLTVYECFDSYQVCLSAAEEAYQDCMDLRRNLNFCGNERAFNRSECHINWSACIMSFGYTEDLGLTPTPDFVKDE